jgi:DNA-binding GntR family transcriptional regulator
MLSNREQAVIGSADGIARTRTGVKPINQEFQSLVDKVTHVVRQSIVEGRTRPGEALSISDLAIDLGVSPSPVREALQRLAGQGLVELRPARTPIVAPLELEDLHEIYRLRLLLEVDAVARACPQLTDEDLRDLKAEFEAMTTAPADSDHFWDSHDAFHQILWRPVFTERLSRLITQLWQAGQRYLRVVYGETDALQKHSPLERHLPLLEAARARDGVIMRAALTEHLASSEGELASKLAAVLGAADA